MLEQMVEFAKNHSMYEDDDFYFPEESSLLEEFKDSHVSPIFSGDKIIAIIRDDLMLGEKFAYILFGKITKASIPQLREKGIKFLASDEDYKFLSKVTKESTFSKEATYNMFLWHTVWSLDKENVNLIRDLYEKEHFPEFTGNLTITVRNGIEMRDFLMGRPVNDSDDFRYWKKSNSSPAYPGMHYFYSEGEHFSKDLFWLTAQIGETIVGAMHFGQWYGSPLTVSYIDVSVKYRQMGIARKMVEEFARLVDGKIKLLKLTALSDMGKTANIEKLFEETFSCEVQVGR